MPNPDLEHYYDRNTALFLRIGSSSGAHAIHRGLWGPGVRNGRDAAEYVNTLLAQRIRATQAPRVLLDLGCGVGGSLFSLARAFPEARLHGVTLSKKQVEIAQALALQQGRQDQCRFIAGDFEHLRLELRADVIFAVESFVHTSRPERFLATCRDHLAPGGQVLIVDDFLARPLPSQSHLARRTIERFRDGWQVPGLCTREAFDTAATTAGFTVIEDTDLTPLIRTGRPRDWLVAACSAPARALGAARWPFWANVIGGHALNRSLRSGWIRYHMITLSLC